MGATTDRYVVISADCHGGASIQGYKPFLASRYHADFDHFAEYTADIDARGVTTAVGDYLARYVHAPATFEDYLGLFGGARLKRAQDAARELVPGLGSEGAGARAS